MAEILPEWSVEQWFNTGGSQLSLSDFPGKVVVIEAFQMLCPGCVLHGLPLAQQIHESFPRDQVEVIGLHSVFEHHAAMTAVSLKAFLHEYRIGFPVGVDTPGKGPLPLTMERYGLRGTPSLLIVDQQGQLVSHHFGQISALKLGTEIGRLLAEQTHTECDGEGCVVS